VNDRLNTYTPRNQQQKDNYNETPKTTLRKIVKSWNKLKQPNLTKVRGKVINSLPCIDVKLNKDLTIKSLLDTGASKNFISKELYEILLSSKLIIEHKNWSGTILAANDNPIDIISACRVKIKIAHNTWVEEFLVIKQNHFPMILGTPFIKNKGLTLELHKQTCYFKFNPGNKLKLHMDFDDLSLNNIKIGTAEMKKEVEELVAAYPNVFTDDIGEALDLEVELKLTDDKPICIRPYFLSPPTLIKMKQIVDQWLSQGIIEPSTSQWSSPAFLTAKNRLVVNYSELNKKLVKMNYPIGDLQNMYQHLRGANYFTVIDLNKAFLQCPLAKNSRDITSFSTIFGKYQMKRVCFGLQVGSSVLSSYLDKVFNDIKFKYVINFCDDIIIYSSSKSEHLEHVKEVIARLSKHKLTVNVDKAKFFCQEVSFLGHIIKNNTVTIDPERTVAIKNFPVPKNVKQVRQFTGMCSYWAKYIPRFAEICVPLHALKRKGAKFIWTTDCQHSFDLLKEKISNPPVLQLADFSKPFILETDASNRAAGGVLLQENEDNDLLPVAYYSKKFNGNELKYSIYEKEAYSVILCMEKWHEFLEVRPFKLRTDNQALSYVLNTQRKLGRLSRWVERLLNLPFTVEHKKGAENVLADTLSRLYDESNETEGKNNADQTIFQTEECLKVAREKKHNKTTCNRRKNKFVNKRVNSSCKFHAREKKEDVFYSNLINEIPLAFNDLRYHQNCDQKCCDIIASINNKTNQECYFIRNNVLMYKGPASKAKIYLPERLTNMIFTFYHNSLFGGHLGITRTQSRINEYFYNPDLNAIIRDKVKKCKVCMMSKSSQVKYEGKLISIPIEQTMNTVFIDILGPLPRSKAQNKFILVIVDGFSRYLWLHALRECNSKLIIKKLHQVFTDFSTPRIIVSDNASYFTSKDFKCYLFKNYIQHRRIAAYRANGNRCERYIRELSSLLRSFYHDEQTSWDANLGLIQTSLNTAQNSSTGQSAFKMMFYHDCNNALSNLWDIQDLVSNKISEEEKCENLKKAINNIKRSNMKNRSRLKYTDPRNKHPFKKNSIVYVRKLHDDAK